MIIDLPINNNRCARSRQAGTSRGYLPRKATNPIAYEPIYSLTNLAKPVSPFAPITSIK